MYKKNNIALLIFQILFDHTKSAWYDDNIFFDNSDYIINRLKVFE